ncbi:MAG: hypothetical protein CVU00_02865 [Bacteroidetes bacterium HGW-Bacteroidetes-17]|jgi:hypothetical protein|nr:MAG: hypothetical protein CVU00_02865 [Bacteroidetes bacterium HGW-Bacteroidetes-17]
MKKSFLITILLCSFSIIYAQNNNTEIDTLRKDALNVFMQASDYIRKEITFVNYVRDINDASIYIISSSQATGSGGRETTYFLTGQHEYAGMNDTISTVSSPDDTEEILRMRQVNILKMGLMRFVVKTPLAKHININFTQPLSDEVSIDKWDSWVFRTRINGYLIGQKSYNSSNVYGSFSTSRVTSDWKMRYNLNFSHSSDKFEIDDEIIKSTNKSKSFSTLVVKSLNDHWSFGGTARIGSSSYSNEDIASELLPSIEYDIFPYSESTRRQLRILYSIGAYHYQYTDTTIYNKTKESMLGHQLSAAYEVVQKWGSVEMSMRWKNYFFDWKMNNLMLEGFINLRVAKGLTFDVGGYYELIHDQLSLVKGGATSDEILLRRKELETGYSFFVQFGISYTFGSIYNNVVNPRFGN